MKHKIKLTGEDLKSIAAFHRIVLNYLKMLKLKSECEPINNPLLKTKNGKNLSV